MSAEEDGKKAAPSSVYKDINKLRSGNDGAKSSGTCCFGACSLEPVFNDTPFAWLAQNKKFEAMTFLMIGLNAVAIGHDADYNARYGKPDNLYEGPIGFIFLENSFCIYFTFEVVVRFWAFKRKLDCVRDAWFVFDGLLVTLMVVETWILPIFGGGSFLSQFAALRLLRLLRISRMARLMRAVPQLVIIIKGMIAATRTVLCTGILLVLVTYTWAILFTSEFHEGLTPNGNPRQNCDDCALATMLPMPDCENCIEGGAVEERFGTMGKSFFSLYVMGTVLDDITACTDAIRGAGKPHMLIAFIIFILIASFTMLNMLVGVLCEVVAATTDGEEKKNLEDTVSDAIQTIFQGMDENDDKMISRQEFDSMRDDPSVMEALSKLDIKDSHFKMYGELFFQCAEGRAEETTLSFEHLFTMILRLRPGTTVGALDFATFQRQVAKCHINLQENVARVQAKARAATIKLSKARGGANGASPPPLTKTELLARLQKVGTPDIMVELQRRLGTTDLRPITGIANGCGGTQGLGITVAAVNAPGDPGAEWSQEVHTC